MPRPQRWKKEKENRMVSETYISRLPYWDDLTEGEKETAVRNSVIRRYKKDTYIYGLHDACLGMIYVTKGSIRVFIISEGGREVTFFHIAEGESCILSASCVLDEISLEVQLMADADTEILAVQAGAYQKIMESNLKVKCFSYELSSKRLSSIVWVMQQILFVHFDERLARFLIMEYEKTGKAKIQMTQEVIAREVNSAREVVARMLRQFVEDQWIEMGRGSITLKDIKALKNLIS